MIRLTRSRRRTVREALAPWTVALAVSACPATALADVLEVGSDGEAHWISSRPDHRSSTDSISDTAGGQWAATLPAAAVPVTEPGLTAGPGRWQARIAELAVKYDISPALLEAVVWQESRWSETARSPAGARGLAQLMPATARAMGVDPDDPHANLEGGARYLRMQLDRFGGDLESALAAYNAGPGRVQRAGGIPAIRETRNYVASIMSRLSDPVRR